MKRQMIIRTAWFFIFTLLHYYIVLANDSIGKDVMQRIYQEVRTPYKYG